MDARARFPDSGLDRTVQWYLANRDWCPKVQEGNYWRERLGLVKA